MDAKRQRSSIVLSEAQTAHVARLAGILAASPCALDLSALGAGKTFCAAALSQLIGARHVVVVAPVSVHPKWREISRTYGVPVSEVTSFASARKVDGLVSEARLEQGTLLVVDEVQNVKNVSAQFAAVRQLIASVVRSAAAGGLSRVLCMSGTPLDKVSQAVTVFRYLGVMTSERLAARNPGTRLVVWHGMDEIVAACRRLAPERTDALVAANSRRLRMLSYRLFQDVYKPAVSSALPPPPNGCVVRKRNAFYEIDGADVDKLRHAIGVLEGAIRIEADGTATLPGVEAMKAVTRSMQAIEAAKVRTFARVARAKIETGFKVAVCVNYRSSIVELAEALREFEPLVLDGRTCVAERARVMERFQRPDGAYRLLIGNIAVCGTGIDLDDKHGGRPRFCLASPNYRAIDIHQLGHRFVRSDSRSDADMHLVFGKGCSELPILDALARKSAVLGETAPLEGIPYPGDYGEVVEEDGHAARWAAANVIKRAWLRAWYDPRYRMCRGRIEREAGELPGPSEYDA